MNHVEPEGYLTQDDLENICDHLNASIIKNDKLQVSDLEKKSEEEVIDIITNVILSNFEEKTKEIPSEIITDFERQISLKVIDEAWVKHISSMEHLKEGIGLRGYGQTNPLQAYALEGYEIFDKMLESIDERIANFLIKMQIKQQITPKQSPKGIANDGKETLKQKPKKSEKIGRNDLCPCGSGRKYKQCCGK